LLPKGGGADKGKLKMGVLGRCDGFDSLKPIGSWCNSTVCQSHADHGRAFTTSAGDIRRAKVYDGRMDNSGDASPSQRPRDVRYVVLLSVLSLYRITASMRYKLHEARPGGEKSEVSDASES
jgi:hypothetical protein